MRRVLVLLLIVCIFLTGCASYQSDYPKVYKSTLEEYLGKYKVGMRWSKIDMEPGGLFPTYFWCYSWRVTYTDDFGVKRSFEMDNYENLVNQLNMESLNKVKDQIDKIAKECISNYDAAVGTGNIQCFDINLIRPSYDEEYILYPKSTGLCSFNADNKFLIEIRVPAGTSDDEIEKLTNKMLEVSECPLNIFVYDYGKDHNDEGRIAYYQDEKVSMSQSDIYGKIKNNEQSYKENS